MSPRCTDMPPVTDLHRQQAYAIVRPAGLSFLAVLALPRDNTLRRIVEIKAQQLRTDAWRSSMRRVTVPVRRCQLGADGQPERWVTQMAPAGYQPIIQPDLLDIWPPSI